MSESWWGTAAATGFVVVVFVSLIEDPEVRTWLVYYACLGLGVTGTIDLLRRK